MNEQKNPPPHTHTASFACVSKTIFPEGSLYNACPFFLVSFRLLYSLIPIRPTDQRQEVPKELYGPTMVVLTLIALLLYQMKTSDHKVVSVHVTELDGYFYRSQSPCLGLKIGSYSV